MCSVLTVGDYKGPGVQRLFLLVNEYFYKQNENYKIPQSFLFKSNNYLIFDQKF